MISFEEHKVIAAQLSRLHYMLATQCCESPKSKRKKELKAFGLLIKLRSELEDIMFKDHIPLKRKDLTASELGIYYGEYKPIGEKNDFV